MIREYKHTTDTASTSHAPHTIAYGTAQHGGRVYRVAMAEGGARYVAVADLAKILNTTVEAVGKRARRTFAAHRALVKFPTSSGDQTMGALNAECLREFLGELHPVAANDLCWAVEHCDLHSEETPAANEQGGQATAAANDHRPEATAGLTQRVPFDGDMLDCQLIDGEPYVSIPAVCRPFGKRSDKEFARLKNEGWARTPVIGVPDERGVPQPTNGIHVDDVHALIFGFSPKGMPPLIKDKWVRYKRECAGALASYFHRGVAVNPRANPDAVRAEVERQIGELLAPLTGKVESLEHGIAKKANAVDVVKRDELDRLKQDMLHVKTIHECAGHDAAINAEGGKRITAALLRYAELVTPLTVRPGDGETAEKARKRLKSANCSAAHTRLRRRLGFFGKGTTWNNLRVSKFMDANDELTQMLAEAERVAEQHRKAQVELFN